MIGESYELMPLPEENRYWFVSIGSKGKILKEVVYQKLEPDKYNLAFGDFDFVSGRLKDAVVSNNFDFVKVMNTVTKTMYDFTERHPNAIIQIQAVDEKRLRFYNIIINRHWKDIEKSFSVWGSKGEGFAPYQENQFYQKFEVKRKSNLKS